MLGLVCVCELKLPVLGFFLGTGIGAEGRDPGDILGAGSGDEYVLTMRGIGTPVGADLPYNLSISVGSLADDLDRGVVMVTGGELGDDDGDPTTNVARRGGVRGELELCEALGGDD